MAMRYAKDDVQDLLRYFCNAIGHEAAPADDLRKPGAWRIHEGTDGALSAVINGRRGGPEQIVFQTPTGKAHDLYKCLQAAITGAELAKDGQPWIREWRRRATETKYVDAGIVNLTAEQTEVAKVYDWILQEVPHPMYRFTADAVYKKIVGRYQSREPLMEVPTRELFDGGFAELITAGLVSEKE